MLISRSPVLVSCASRAHPVLILYSSCAHPVLIPYPSRALISGSGEAQASRRATALHLVLTHTRAGFAWRGAVPLVAPRQGMNAAATEFAAAVTLVCRKLGREHLCLDGKVGGAWAHEWRRG